MIEIAFVWLILIERKGINSELLVLTEALLPSILMLKNKAWRNLKALHEDSDPNLLGAGCYISFRFRS